MEIPEKARHLVQQWSEAIELEGLCFDEDGLVEFEFGEEMRASLGIDDQGEALVLCAELVPSTADIPATVLRRLLITNATQFAKRGPTYAIPPLSGGVALQQRLPLAGITYLEFEETLVKFSEAWEKSKAKLATLLPGNDADSAPVSAAAEDADPGLIFFRP